MGLTRPRIMSPVGCLTVAVAVAVACGQPAETSATRTTGGRQDSAGSPSEGSQRRSCGSATSGNLGDPPASPGSVMVGPIRFEAVHDPAGGLADGLSKVVSSKTTYLVFKTPLTIPATVAGGITVRITREIGHVRLIYAQEDLDALSAGTYRLPDAPSEIFFESCGGAQYNGGFIMAGPGCAEVEATDEAGRLYGPVNISFTGGSYELPVSL